MCSSRGYSTSTMLLQRALALDLPNQGSILGIQTAAEFILAENPDFGDDEPDEAPILGYPKLNLYAPSSPIDYGNSEASDGGGALKKSATQSKSIPLHTKTTISKRRPLSDYGIHCLVSRNTMAFLYHMLLRKIWTSACSAGPA
jgi:hypothetical protein